MSDHTSKGQTIVILAGAFLVLVAFVGLATDAGLAFIAYGKLSRAADAAALSAAAQFREGRSVDEMRASAENAMAVNGVNFNEISIRVCDYSLPEDQQDPLLCPQPDRKKLVQIQVSANVPLAFLRVIGIDSANLSVMSIAEAASVDVVLVIDISESMAWDNPSGDPLRDPNYCNDTIIFDGSEDAGEYPLFPNGLSGECHPFEEVKNAAGEFINRILDKPADAEEDRLAIVTFGTGWSSDENLGTFVRTSGWTNNKSNALTIVENLKIVQPEPCFWADGSERTLYGPCAWYDPPDPINSGNFVQTYCNSCADSGDLSGLTTTNIGGGMRLAGNMFGEETREEALWVVILLTDGNANATTPEMDDNIEDYNTYPIGFCPNDWIEPLCQDEDVSSRHGDGDVDYDADDYARDMADFVGCPSTDGQGSCVGIEGQAAVIFTIGLGDRVTDNSNEINGLPYGTALLRYIAAVGDDTNPLTDPCNGLWDNQNEWREWCGHYYFSPSGDQLSAVFLDIASRVFTRLTR
jgi:hypothetical protein